jgi:hypothetical protein
MVRHPLSPMGVTTELIEGSPFSTFTWPGVLLLTLLGIAPLVLAVGVLARVRGTVALSGAFGAGLMAWIGAQWVMLADRLWLQPLMFGIGLAILGLSTVLYRLGPGEPPRPGPRPPRPVLVARPQRRPLNRGAQDPR